MAEEHHDATAGVLMGHFQAAGLVAPAQADALLNAFREHQRNALSAILGAAVADGLVDAKTRDSVQSNFESQLLSVTPEEFLIDQGVLTRDQAQKYSSGLSGAVRAMRGAVTGAASGGKMVGSGLVSRFKALSTAGKLAVAGGGAVVGIVAICFISMMWLAFRPQPIEPDCVMNGFGNGKCTFTNTTSRTSASSCGKILAHCTGRGTETSVTLCSGEVEPGDSKAIDFSVPGFDRISPSGDWRDTCEFGWVAADD
ncbi:MAG: hypothetical protein ACOC9T_01820 [Myxococcota bacterium]